VNERDGFYLTDIYSVWTASKNGRKFVMQTANGIGTVPFEWERWRANPSGALVSVKEIYEPSITDLITEGQARALDEWLAVCDKVVLDMLERDTTTTEEQKAEAREFFAGHEMQEDLNGYADWLEERESAATTDT
jgi:hypothetical protein